jgi:hypothetical protein
MIPRVYVRVRAVTQNRISSLEVFEKNASYYIMKKQNFRNARHDGMMQSQGLFTSVEVCDMVKDINVFLKLSHRISLHTKLS